MRHTGEIQDLLSLSHLQLKQPAEEESVSQMCLSKKYCLEADQYFKSPCQKWDSWGWGFLPLFCGGAGSLQLPLSLVGLEWGPCWAYKRGQEEWKPFASQPCLRHWFWCVLVGFLTHWQCLKWRPRPCEAAAATASQESGRGGFLTKADFCPALVPHPHKYSKLTKLIS